MAGDDRHRAADRVVDARDGEVLADLIGRALGIIAGESREGDLEVTVSK